MIFHLRVPTVEIVDREPDDRYGRVVIDLPVDVTEDEFRAIDAALREGDFTLGGPVVRTPIEGGT